MKVLDHGNIKLLNFMGGEQCIIENARVCTDSQGTDEENEKLLNFLIEKEHETPMEVVIFRFEVKAPIFVARQWFRHRMSSFNEKSLRYTQAKPEFYIPESWKDVEIVKPSHSPTGFSYMKLYNKILSNYDEIIRDYYFMLDEGIPKEQARTILPVSLYTEFIWTVNLRSLLNFLKLRLDKHAQMEIREYANKIVKLIQPIVPNILESYLKKWSNNES